MADRLSPAMRRQLVNCLQHNERSPRTYGGCPRNTLRALQSRGLAEGEFQWYLRLTPAGRAEARRIREEEQRA